MSDHLLMLIDLDPEQILLLISKPVYKLQTMHIQSVYSVHLIFYLYMIWVIL